jgi:hypothetical protein
MWHDVGHGIRRDHYWQARRVALDTELPGAQTSRIHARGFFVFPATHNFIRHGSSIRE